MRWTLSFPIDALDTQLPSSRDGSSSNILGRAEHPSTAGYANPDNDLVGHTSYNALRIFTGTFQRCSSLRGDPSTEWARGFQLAENRERFCWSIVQAKTGGVNPLSLQQPLCRAALHSGRSRMPSSVIGLGNTGAFISRLSIR